MLLEVLGKFVCDLGDVRQMLLSVQDAFQCSELSFWLCLIKKCWCMVLFVVCITC